MNIYWARLILTSLPLTLCHPHAVAAEHDSGLHHYLVEINQEAKQTAPYEAGAKQQLENEVIPDRQPSKQEIIDRLNLTRLNAG